MSPYLQPTASFAGDVILTTNPAEAMAIAQATTDGPLMANHSHGLWGYTGPTTGGGELTIQSTGIGGPSAAAVLFELAELGVRRAVRVGRARPLAGGPPELVRVVVAEALGADGTSRALARHGALTPDPGLTDSVRVALGPEARAATVLSADLEAELDAAAHPRGGEAAVGDLETAAVLAAGDRAGVAVAGALLAVNGASEVSRGRLVELGVACAAAFAGGAPRRSGL